MKTKRQLIKDLQDEYAQCRAQAKSIANDYLQYICEKYPDFGTLHKLKQQIEFKIMRNKYECAEKIQQEVNQLNTQLNSINELYFKFAKEHNIETSRFEPKHSCPICEDYGYVNHKMCNCFRTQLNRLLNKQNITRNLSSWDKSITLDIERDKIQQRLKQWSKIYPDTNISTILLLGTPGTGKTFNLECITSELISRDIGVIFTTAFEFNEQCRKYHCSQDNVLTDFIDTEVLIIDDLGSEPMLNNVTVEYLYNIIDSRQRYNKATLISSNLGLNTLLSRYGERTFSRLNNINLGLTINVLGDDLRRTRLRRNNDTNN